MANKNIITYGTFDLLHIGHVNFLKKARALGSYLMVGLSTDEFNQLKHKTSFMTYQDRRIILQSIRYVDFVFAEKNWGQKLDDIKKYNADMFVIGDDWQGKFDYLKAYCEVKYLDRTPQISTTQLKRCQTK